MNERVYCNELTLLSMVLLMKGTVSHALLPRCYTGEPVSRMALEV